MEQSCLFCLEVIKEPPLLNPVGCKCKIQSHRSCIEKWFQEKQQLECPICHKSPADNVSIQIHVPTQAMLQTVQVNYFDIVRVSIQENRFRNHDKMIGYCACFCLLWGVAFAIVDILLRN